MLLVAGAAPPAGAGFGQQPTVMRGALTADDPALRSGRRVDAYEVPAVAGQTIAVTLQGEGFNTYLTVIAPGDGPYDLESLYLRAEDLADWANARQEDLARMEGSWVLLVTPRQTGLAGGELGSYRLSVEVRGADGTPARPAVRPLAAEWVRALVAADQLEREAQAAGDSAQRAELLVRSSGAYRRLGRTARAFWALRRAAGAYEAADRPADALRTARQAHGLARAEQLSELEAYALRAISELYLMRTSNLDSAHVYRERAEAVAKRRSCPGACDGGGPGAAAPASLRGSLTPADPAYPSRGYVDAYDVELQRGQRLRAALRTDSIDGFLVLVPPTGGEVVEEDGTLYEATIDREIPDTGVWRVLVTTYLEEARGDYALAVQLGGAAAPVRQVDPERVRAWLAARELARQAAGQGPTAEAAALFERAARGLLAVDRGAEAVLLMLQQGVVLQGFGQVDTALLRAREALRLAQEIEQAPLQAVAHFAIGHLHQRLSRPDSARAALEQALAIQRRIGDPAEALTLESIAALDAEAIRADSSGAVRGEFAAADPTLAGGEPVHAYSITPQPGQRVRLTLRGERSGVRLRLVSPSGETVEGAAVDSVPGALAIEQPLVESGSWLVVVSHTPGRAAGAYRLTAEARDGAAPGRGLARVPPHQVRAYAEAHRLREEARRAGVTREAAQIEARVAESLQTAGRAREAIWAWLRSSELYRRVSRPAEAHTHLTFASLVSAQEPEPRVDAALALQSGALRGDEGDASGAILSYHRALDLATGMRDGTLQGRALHGLGSVHEGLGRIELARDHYYRAGAAALPARNPETIGEILQGLGSVHLKLSKPDSALYYLRLALGFYGQVAGGAEIGPVLSDAGHAHALLGRPDSALFYSHRALAAYRSVGDRAGEGGALRMLGRFQAELGRRDSAFVYLREALRLQRQGSFARGEALTLADMAELHHRSAPRDLASAVAHYDSAWTVYGALRENAGSDANRMSFAEQQAYLSGDWARAWLGRAGEVGAPASQRLALAAVERGRAQSLLDLMRGSRRTEPGADLRTEADALLAAAARRGTAVLTYTLTADTVLAWLVLPSGELSVHRVALSDTALARQVTQLRQGLAVDSAAERSLGEELDETRSSVVGQRRRAGEYESHLRALGAALLPAELMAGLPAGSDLVVIPQGVLALLPFAALPADGGPLGVRFRLRYAPSLAALEEAAERASPLSGAGRAGAFARALVVGNPAMPEVQSAKGETLRLAALPGAENEGRQVAAQLGAPFLTGAQAGEAEVLRRMRTAPVIHLATHGYAYGTEARARHSFIALAAGEEEDGLLTVGEVLDEGPSLAADLVVLSACQTGLGDLKRAEGTVGLQWAFLAKGARSVLVSLWSVDDAVTERLMRSFYRHWTAGESKAEALRRAQEEVRATHPNPRYWAAFQLVGAN